MLAAVVNVIVVLRAPFFADALSLLLLPPPPPPPGRLRPAATITELLVGSRSTQEV